MGLADDILELGRKAATQPPLCTCGHSMSIHRGPDFGCPFEQSTLDRFQLSGNACRCTGATEVHESTDFAAELAGFLVDRTGSCLRTWKGPLAAQEQKKLFGKYTFGKKKIWIDGARETVSASWKLAFGTDWDFTRDYKWSEFPLSDQEIKKIGGRDGISG